MQKPNRKIRSGCITTPKTSQLSRSISDQSSELQEQQQQQMQQKEENNFTFNEIETKSPTTTNNTNQPKEKCHLTPKGRKKIYNDNNTFDIDNCDMQEATLSTPKKYAPSTDEIQTIYKNTFSIQNDKGIFDDNTLSSTSASSSSSSSLDNEIHLNTSNRYKRVNEDKIDEEPKEKYVKIQEQDEQQQYISPLKPELPETSSSSQYMTIPSEKFYSKTPSPSHLKPDAFAFTTPASRSNLRKPKKSRIKRESGLINKGVFHKIRRRRHHKQLKPQKAVSVEEILKSLSTDKFQKLREKQKFNKNNKEISNIYKNLSNSDDWMHPLNNQGDESDREVGFSGNEYESDDNEMEVIASEGRTIKNLYKINNPMEVNKEMNRDQLAKSNIFDTEQKTANDIIDILDTTGEEEEDESSTIEQSQIIEEIEVVTTDANNLNRSKLDDEKYAHFYEMLPYNTTNPDLIENQHLLLEFLIMHDMCTEENFKIFISDPANHKTEAANIIASLAAAEKGCRESHEIKENNDTELNTTDYEDFWKRLPYNTTDPGVIKQQEDLLTYLIRKNICNEENFKIFISDPDNHKAEADAIILNSILTLKENNEDVYYDEDNSIMRDIDSDQHISYQNSLSSSPISSMLIEENTEMLDCSEKSSEQIENTHPNCQAEANDKHFPIFYPGKCQQLKPISIRKYHPHQRWPDPHQWNHGIGLNQYQIDSGQKEFGAKQCPKCGLIYTVHEPEEEKLHEDYHNSMFILKFKGWIDEDVVMTFPEWSLDGRIIKVTHASHAKRHERVKDIVKFIDQELGFSSYIIPNFFAAYFAIKNQHIVGFCLVEPLEMANRYICVNGVDCCTEDVFPARCGISRIWVSPFHRRMGIASKLINAVQLFTIMGEKIDMNKIAFNSPTPDGKAFAKIITKQNNFLLYQ